MKTHVLFVVAMIATCVVVAPAFGADQGHMVLPNPWAIAPFALLLVCIAALPLIPGVNHWWEENKNRAKVAGGFAALTLLYYLFLHDGLFDVESTKHVLKHAMVDEYFPFIVLLGALFTVAGGIRIGGDLLATPSTNTKIMAFGTGIASFIGTCGASMLLIFLLLRTNQQRKHAKHTVIFFIFTVCNCGGLLLPIGDPPLFLGYLQGVPFTWTFFELFVPWLLVNSYILLTYYLLDKFYYYRKEDPADLERDAVELSPIRVDGWKLNAPLLIGIVLAVAFLDPRIPIPGTNFRAWPYVRELIQIGILLISFYLGPKKPRQDNNFSFHAINEVAVVFAGIFICMQPALQLLSAKGDEISWLGSPGSYYLVTGGLSAWLDNAPTYLVFFKVAQGDMTVMEFVHQEVNLVAISLAAVFWGSMSYIGNGPNFMVRAVAEKSGVQMPSFFGYIGWACAFLLPALILVYLWIAYR